jgi:hypothetical protein
MFVKFVKMCSCQFFKMCSLTSLMFQLRTDGENDEKMMRQWWDNAEKNYGRSWWKCCKCCFFNEQLIRCGSDI